MSLILTGWTILLTKCQNNLSLVNGNCGYFKGYLSLCSSYYCGDYQLFMVIASGGIISSRVPTHQGPILTLVYPLIH